MDRSPHPYSARRTPSVRSSSPGSWAAARVSTARWPAEDSRPTTTSGRNSQAPVRPGTRFSPISGAWSAISTNPALSVDSPVRCRSAEYLGRSGRRFRTTWRPRSKRAVCPSSPARMPVPAIPRVSRSRSTMREIAGSRPRSPTSTLLPASGLTCRFIPKLELAGPRSMDEKSPVSRSPEAAAFRRFRPRRDRLRGLDPRTAHTKCYKRLAAVNGRNKAITTALGRLLDTPATIRERVVRAIITGGSSLMRS